MKRFRFGEGYQNGCKFINRGLVNIEQAAKSIDLTKEQLLASFKEYNLVL